MKNVEDPTTSPIVLDPSDQRGTARVFLERQCSHPDAPRLIHFHDDFYYHGSESFDKIDPTTIGEQLYRFTEGAEKPVGNRGDTEPFKPKKNDVIGILHALACLVHETREPPMWRDGRKGIDPNKIIAAPNGLWLIEDGELRKVSDPTPGYWNLNAIDYDVDPDAEVPRDWLRFLDSICPGDPDALQLIQEWFYYSLTGQTWAQKILMLIGPPRSGKGTLGRAARKLVGERNVVAPTLSSIGSPFGLWPWLGKRLAIISDGRMRGGAESGMILERLLSISGEDPQTIDRKCLQPITTTLQTRIMILTNELPRLIDSSGAMASRFLIVNTPKSFLGAEDTGLTDRLLKGLPGILRWAVAGQLTLAARGKFLQPASGARLQEELADLTSPVGQFVRECCNVSTGASVAVDDLYQAWRGWCAKEGRDHPGPSNLFARDLNAAVSGLSTSRPRSLDGKRIRQFDGIEMNDEGTSFANARVVKNTTNGGTYGQF